MFGKGGSIDLPNNLGCMVNGFLKQQWHRCTRMRSSGKTVTGSMKTLGKDVRPKALRDFMMSVTGSSDCVPNT